MIQDLTDAELEDRLTILEHEILTEQDWKNLLALNAAFQSLLDEQARRNMAKDDSDKKITRRTQAKETWDAIAED